MRASPDDASHRRANHEARIELAAILRDAASPLLRMRAVGVVRNDGKDMRSHSRGMICPSFATSLSLLEQRAQGKPGADCARIAVCQK